MTDEELAAIRARAEAATPGPWVMDASDGIYAPSVDEHVASGDGQGCGIWGADAEFVIHARVDVPALLAEAELLRAFKATTAQVLTALAEEIPEVMETFEELVKLMAAESPTHLS